MRREDVLVGLFKELLLLEAATATKFTWFSADYLQRPRARESSEPAADNPAKQNPSRSRGSSSLRPDPAKKHFQYSKLVPPLNPQNSAIILLHK